MSAPTYVFSNGSERPSFLNESTRPADNNNNSEDAKAHGALGKDNDFVLRWVRPYDHRFESSAKGRWLGRSLMDVLTSEFAAFNKAYFEKSLDEARVCINGKREDADYIFKNKDLLSHRCCIQEPPVVDAQLRVFGAWRLTCRVDSESVAEPPKKRRKGNLVAEDEVVDDIIFAVSKPAGWSVHPGGAYRYNSMIQIVKNDANVRESCQKMIEEKCVDIEVGKPSDESAKCDKGSTEKSRSINLKLTSLTKLYTLHRLDRVTSGLIFVGTSQKATKFFDQLIRTREIKKVYIARVIGNFATVCSSGGDINVRSDDLGSDESAIPLLDAVSLFVERAADVQNPVESRVAAKCFTAGGWHGCRSRRLGIWGFVGGEEESPPVFEADDPEKMTELKWSKTSFLFCRYDEKLDESLVLCSPVTGRTHQIRVHLQSLGHPISNDVCYLSDHDLSEQSRSVHPKRWAYSRSIRHVNLDDANNCERIDDREQCSRDEKNKEFHESGIFLHSGFYQTDYFRVVDDLPKWCSDLIANEL